MREAFERSITVVPIPGPSSLIAALSAAGLPEREFTFVGFLPARRTARRARLAELAGVPSTLIFYEAPHRIKETIDDARELLGNRDCVLAREVTKLHEEFVRGRLSEIELSDGATRGEMVLMIGPPLDSEQPEAPQLTSILERTEQIARAGGLDQKAALKQAARERGISKSEAYRRMIAERNRSK